MLENPEKDVSVMKFYSSPFVPIECDGCCQFHIFGQSRSGGNCDTILFICLTCVENFNTDENFK